MAKGFIESLTLKPIMVQRGRKFKGHGYQVEAIFNEDGFRRQFYDNLIWDPQAKRTAYANPNYIEDDPIPTKADIDRETQAYIDFVVASVVKRCTSGPLHVREQDPSSCYNYIRNSLLWKLPASKVDELYPDTRSVAQEVERTIRWASGLKTKPTTLYGKFCPGGKDYSRTRKAEAAYKALRHKGFTKRPEFEAAWMMWTEIFDLPDVRSKVEAKLAAKSYEEYYSNDYV